MAEKCQEDFNYIKMTKKVTDPSQKFTQDMRKNKLNSVCLNRQS